MINKKGALELSINTLVIIIISLVILGAGISLMYQFISGAESIKASLDAKTEAELERLLVNQGERVALPLHVAEIERGDSHVFGIGILNVLGENEEFVIKVNLKKVIDENEKDITSTIKKSAVEAWLMYVAEPIFIADGAHHSEPILVNVPDDAVKGQYVFAAIVERISGDDYGNPQLFYAVVK